MLDAPGCVLVACSSFGSKERTSFTDALGHGVLAVINRSRIAEISLSDGLPSR